MATTTTKRLTIRRRKSPRVNITRRKQPKALLLFPAATTARSTRIGFIAKLLVNTVFSSLSIKVVVSPSQSSSFASASVDDSNSNKKGGRKMAETIVLNHRMVVHNWISQEYDCRRWCWSITILDELSSCTLRRYLGIRRRCIVFDDEHSSSPAESMNTNRAQRQRSASRGIRP